MIGSDFVPQAPVVLAPMAGVTNAPFRALCRRFGPGLVYVNEMVMATAVVHGNAKTERMMTFDPDEHPRSLQVYGSDPVMMGRAVDAVCGRGLVDHVDLNFGCPAAKVTRKGGGAAVPARPSLLRAIVRAAVAAAAPYGVPVTAKFRIGLHDELLTHLRTGEICAEEGIAAIAAARPHGPAALRRRRPLGRHRRAQGARPDDPGARQRRHLGGRRRRRDDAATGCDGVVVGRGCLGRPWLFGDLLEVFAGRPAPPSRPLGFAAAVMPDHARALVDHHGDERNRAMRTFRKHASWYLTGYPVGGQCAGASPRCRRSPSWRTSSAGSIRRSPSSPGGERIRRGHTNGPIKVSLPDGLPRRSRGPRHDLVVPDDDDVMALSGG